MDLCNKLLLKCSALIALSLALQIFTSPATIHNAKETTVHKMTQNNKNATTQQENIFSNLYNNSYINTSNNPTIPTRYNSTNSTDFDSTHHSLTVPSPTAEITTLLINVTATKTNFATQFASDTTRAAVSTPRPPVSTVHDSNESIAKSTLAYFTTGTDIDNKTNNETAAGAGLNHSEMSLTILFSVVLGMTLLIILALAVYKMTRSKLAQYSHHPLHNEDTGGLFMVTDETLLTSEGLCDDPQIYKSTVTALNEDQTFTYTPTQFRLEFLNEDPATDHTQEATTFKTFNTTGQQP
ncbi:sialomucin core protein 24-like isoform X2 [Hemibagrus wyckioides]|uniref:sialomucin core protein 24-like isoform X2 n=1 Tax=Hemibagrus wyckioides TaxID=337641 RepID=UPI00266CDDD7|nr:sialomucin core protein 24-like isoform X2 [Hemibagrus wyckioides]